MASSLFFSVGSIGLSKRGKRSPSTILMAARHNRRAEQNERGSRANINPELSHLNQRLRGPSTAEEVAALARTIMAAAGVAVDKLRKDYTQAVELLFSLPPDTTINTQEYFERCVVWVERHFGAGNILSADVHRDEAAPHCHVLVLPLVDGQMRGANLLALSHVARLRDDFDKEVAKHYGMRKAARLDGVSRGALAVAVLDRLKASGDPVMRSPVWNEVRAAVERDPAPFAQALGVEVAKPSKKLRTVTEILISKGKKTAEDRNLGFKAKKQQNLSCVGFPSSPPSFQPQEPQIEQPVIEPQVVADEVPVVTAVDGAEVELHQVELHQVELHQVDGLTRIREDDMAAGQWCEELGEWIAPTHKSKAGRAAADAWVAQALAHSAARNRWEGPPA